MADVALGGMAVYLGAVVTGRTVLARRWPRTRFVVMQVRSWSGAEWLAATIAAVSVVGLGGGTVAAAFGRTGPSLPTGDAAAGAGIAVMTGAVILMEWAQIAMGPSWRVGLDRRHPPALVTTGPFRSVRNPIYTAMVAAGSGVALVVPTVWTIAGAGALIAFVEWQVRFVEEPFLALAHPTVYATWAKRTGRFVPQIGRVS
ncbi:MAG TPA: isoprenylcysteine carboxylmethyltransferase family protein [Acidimicrobiales bacterium]|nr:isoprenylcysteine carboxylmethyltransferase family protein [Acidimicrobiales bacterium]